MWCWGGIAPCHLPLPFPPAAEGASPFRPAPCVRVMLPSGTARLDLMALPRRKTGDRCCQGPRRGWEYRDIFFWSCLHSRDGQFHLINCHVATLDCRSRSISALQPLGVPWCHAGSQGAAVFGEPLHHKCLLVSPQAILLAWERGEGENRERGLSRAVNRRGTR